MNDLCFPFGLLIDVIKLPSGTRVYKYHPRSPVPIVKSDVYKYYPVIVRPEKKYEYYDRKVTLFLIRKSDCGRFWDGRICHSLDQATITDILYRNKPSSGFPEFKKACIDLGVTI